MSALSLNTVSIQQQQKKTNPDFLNAIFKSLPSWKNTLMASLAQQLQFSPIAQTAVLTAEFSLHNIEAGLNQNTEF